MRKSRAGLSLTEVFDSLLLKLGLARKKGLKEEHRKQIEILKQQHRDNLEEVKSSVDELAANLVKVNLTQYPERPEWGIASVTYNRNDIRLRMGTQPFIIWTERVGSEVARQLRKELTIKEESHGRQPDFRQSHTGIGLGDKGWLGD